MPGVIAGALMAFTLSIDDFVITFFTAGAGTVTLPLQIYSMIKIAVTPEVNAVSTLLMLLTLAADHHRLASSRPACLRTDRGSLTMKRVASLVACRLRRVRRRRSGRRRPRTSCTSTTGTTTSRRRRSSASRQSCKCEVVQTYYSDNEELLAKLAAGAKGYDVLRADVATPSQALIKRRAAEAARQVEAAEPQEHRPALPQHAVRSRATSTRCRTRCRRRSSATTTRR